jgi:hypothetical protein
MPREDAMSFESKEEQPSFGPLPGHRLFLKDGRNGEIAEVGQSEGEGMWSVSLREGQEFHVVAWDDDFNAWAEVWHSRGSRP